MSLKKLGRYEITGTLGRGAMGVVYQAHDPLIERTVAIKTISYAGLTPAEAEDFEQRFFREAKSAGRLNHPNIVTIYDVGHGDDLAYIAMEFLSGCSLRTLLDSGVVLSYGRIAEIAAGVADGLAFAHANGVVHRDIKPANIMVLDSGIVKVADFGIALLPSGSLTMVGTALGSPKYMSPEQVLGQKADGRSDVFSLGVVLHEMLTGRPPFKGDDLNAILYQVLNGEPPLPSSHNPGLPQGFDRIVTRALAKQPENRYQNAAEMAADLLNCSMVSASQKQGEAADPVAEASVAPRLDDHDAVSIQRQEPSRHAAPGKRGRGSRYAALTAILLGLAGLGWYVWHAQTEAVLPGSVQAADPRATAAQPATVVSPVVVDSPSLNTTPAKANTAGKDETSRNAPAEQATKKIEAAKPVPQVKKQKSPADDAPAKQTASQNWQSALRAELLACSRKSLFPRVYCSESARWKYCQGHWDTTEDCTKGPNTPL